MAFSLSNNQHLYVHGHQTDGAGVVYAGVAQTQWGAIPGKVHEGVAYFSFAGKEHTTNNYQYIHVNNAAIVKNTTGHPPHNAVKAGHQTDGAGDVWAVIVHSPHGDIPGKAIGNDAWYPYAGAEHTANGANFSWIVSQ